MSIFGVLPATLCARPAPPQAPQQNLSLQEYISELDKASAALSAKDAATIRNFRASLPSEWVVQTNGQSTHVKTDWLSATLAAGETHPNPDAPSAQHARQRLAALRDAAESSAQPVPEPDLAQSRAQLDRILSGREFGAAHGPTWFDLLKARVLDWIDRQIEKLFSHIGSSATVGNLIAWILISLAALLLAYWVVRSLLGAGSRPAMDLHGAPPAGQDSRYWSREARIRAERGDYRGAIHAAYWAAVARMEELRLLPEDRSRTPRESLKLVQRENVAYAPLADLTRRFEFIWYGYRVATLADWTGAKQQLETLECLPSSTTATAAW